MLEPRRADIVSATEVVACDLVPEIRLRVAPACTPFDDFRSRAAGAEAVVPYWARAWPGGLALARFVLDRREVVRGRPVVDAGSGSGIAAIAAVMAGAGSALAVDSDPAAALAARLNAEINNVFVETATGDFVRMPVPAGAVILAGDLWYEHVTAVQATAWLRRAAKSAAVLVGDCRRGHFPRHGLEPLASYGMVADTAFECAPQIACGVWRMTAGRATAACPS